MSKHKKIIEDSHYVSLNKTLIEAMARNPHFKEGESIEQQVPQKVARFVFHETMRQTVLSICGKLRLEHPTIIDLVNYHTELKCGDVNHQHPKNVYSELLKASAQTDNELHQVGFKLCMLTIPIDGEYPSKLVEAIDTYSLYLLTDLETNFTRTIVSNLIRPA